MSYMVARMQKMKAENLGGAYRHNERIFSNHSNKDIDTSRSHLNYELTNRDHSVSYERQIKDYVNKNKMSKRAIRKDAVLCDEWIITSDKNFFENLNDRQIRYFFETAKNYFARNYGESNIAYASVHLDESTPHMHLGIVPLKNGALSSKSMFTREELKHIQDELPRHMSYHGFDLQRGRVGSQAKHKTVAEFKQDVAYKELENELVEKYNAPVYFEEIGGDFRKTTLEEKVDWVKKDQLEDIKTLETSKTLIEAQIRVLNDEVVEKTKEVSKINSRTSESLLELSEVENKINVLEKYSKALGQQIENLTEKFWELTLENSSLNIKFMSDKELDEIPIKKGLLGREYVELSKEKFEKFKWSIYKNRSRVNDREYEVRNLRGQLQAKEVRETVNEQIERIKKRMQGEDEESLKQQVRELKEENSILKQQNQKMLTRLEKLLKPKEWNKLISELKAIKPIVEVVRNVAKTIEKGLNR